MISWARQAALAVVGYDVSSGMWKDTYIAWPKK